MANIRGFLDTASNILDEIEQATGTGRKAIGVANHGINAIERMTPSQRKRDWEAAKKIRMSYIKYWNRAMGIWRIMLIATLIVIIFF